MAKPVKVAHVIWSLGLGGAEQVVLGLVRNFDRSRFVPLVVCLDDKGRFAPEAEETGVKVLALEKKRGLDFGLPFRLARLFREQGVGLVHTHLFNGHLWGRLAALLAGLPVISTEHGMDAWRSPLHHALDAVLTLKSARVVFVSEEARKFYRSRVPADARKDRVIFNGIETARFEGRTSRQRIRAEFGFEPWDRVIATAGRFVPEKRHDYFLAVIKKLRDQGLPVKGFLIGDGPLREDTEKQASDLGLKDAVKFAGVRQDLPDLYPAMDLFLLTSDREGLPITILEAMAAGTPIVSTDVGGIHACIQNHVSGRLVPPGDVDALAAAAAETLAHSEKTAQAAAEARQSVRKNFSVKAMVTHYQSLYDEVLKP